MTKILIMITTALLLSAPLASATVGPDESLLEPDAVKVLHYVMATYPEVPSIGGWRQDSIPDHPSGKALDIMIPDMATGDRIAADLRTRQGELGIRYILWRVPSHFNHLHVCVD